MRGEGEKGREMSFFTDLSPLVDRETRSLSMTPW